MALNYRCSIKKNGYIIFTMPTYLSRMRRIRRFSWSVDSTMPGTTCRGSGRLPWRAIWQLKTATWRLQELRRGVTIVGVSQLHSIRSCFSLIITTKTATALQLTLFNFREHFSYSRDSESEPFRWKKICESWTPLLTRWGLFCPFHRSLSNCRLDFANWFNSWDEQVKNYKSYWIDSVFLTEVLCLGRFHFELEISQIDFKTLVVISSCRGFGVWGLRFED